MNISENDNNNENKLKFSSDESNEKDKSIEEENINKIENNSENRNEEEEEQKTINNSENKKEEEEEQKTINNSDIKNVEEEEQKTINNSDIKTINNSEVKNVEEEEQKTINNSDSIEIENNNKSIQNENFEDSKLSASKQSNKEIIKNVEEELNKSDNKSKNQKHSKEKENSINNNISIDQNKSNKTSENNFSRNSISNISYIERKTISNINEKEDYHKKAELYYNSLSQEEKKKLSNIVTYIKGQNHQFEEELKEIFKKLDVNERDKINFEDLKNFLGVLRTNVNNYYINEIIKEYGNDKKEITQKMFIKKMNENIKGKYKKDDITELREIFQLFDTNHDNKISYEDIKNVMNALGETTFNDDMCKEMIRHLKLKANVNNIAINKDNCYLNYNDFIEIVKGESEQ